MGKKRLDYNTIWIKQFLEKNNIEFIEELRFDKIRRFKFDFALVNRNIAIEYEGINSAKSRHTSITGYTNDCTKYNLAIKNGWKVLRYTALNIKELEQDLKELLIIK